MAEIRNFLFLRHLRGEHAAHLLRYRNGKLLSSGRGLSFWFLPMSTSLAEVPVDDRELALFFSARTRDYQEVSAQGVLTFRVHDPELLAERVDFSIDLNKGRHLEKPLLTIAQTLHQRAEQIARAWIAKQDVRDVLATGLDEIRTRVKAGLASDETLPSMGLEIVSLRMSAVKPTTDLERALEAPTREEIQTSADEAAFARRALAVEKERAIQENELQNKIELARREEDLIAQRAQNDRRAISEKAETQELEIVAKLERGKLAADAKLARDLEAASAQAKESKIRAESIATKKRIVGEGEAASLRVLEAARIEAEEKRMDIHRDVPTPLVMALAAHELAGKLHTIEHLSIAPEMLSPMLTDLVRAGTKKLAAPAPVFEKLEPEL